MAVFYDILDKATNNAHVIYKDITQSKISHCQFIIELGKELTTKPDNIEQLLEMANEPTVVAKKKHTCQAGGCKNKTINTCYKCTNFICGQHVALLTKVTVWLCAACK